MKLRYITKNYDQKKNQIDKLREGDQICSGVIDSMSEDYLSYISNLVKNAKTPHKNQHHKEPSLSSQENQSNDQEQSNNCPPNNQQYNTKHQSKIRHHSQTSVKPINLQNIKDIKKKDKGKNNIQSKNQSPKIKKLQNIQAEQQQKNLLKIKKRKIEYSNDALLKNQQKTMSISKNTVHNSKQKGKYVEKAYQNDQKNKNRFVNKSKQKFYITAENYDESDGQNASIQAQISKNNRNTKKLTSIHESFIDNITQYIITLQQKDLIHQQSNSHIKKNKQTNTKKIHRQKKKIKLLDDINYYQQNQIHEILKENLKLKKKNKEYQQKVEALQDEISSHLIQCKNRDKGYKNKIADLISHLTNQNQKIKEQKSQINKFKELLRTVSQKCKQVQHSNEEQSEYQQQKIGQSVIKYLGPTRYNSEMRTKNKKTLESTMPRYDQQRKFW